MLRAPKSRLNYFFQLFSTFFVLFKPFSVFSHLKSTKKVWKWTKKVIFVYSSKLIDMQKLVNSLRGYLKFVFFQLVFSPFLFIFIPFCLFQAWNHWKRLKKNKKSCKRLKKLGQPAFGCAQHPKAGYTTAMVALDTEILNSIVFNGLLCT